LALISLLSDTLLSILGFLKVAKSVRSSKFIRITRLRGAFKAIRTARTVKIINFLILGADSLIELKVTFNYLFFQDNG
jgi:hypothetical protein